MQDKLAEMRVNWDELCQAANDGAVEPSVP